MARRHEDYKLFIEIWQTSASVHEVSRRLSKNTEWDHSTSPSSLYGVMSHLERNDVDLKYLPARSINYGELANLAQRLN